MAATSDERREVAARLRDCIVYAKEYDLDGDCDMGSDRCAETRCMMYNDIASCIEDCGNFNLSAEEVFTRLADLIDPTCVYEPTETLTRWDENDHEHETNEPDPDCATFACSRCGYEMLYGDEYGWFDTEPPYAPHFKFCPNCSARVLPLKLYDKVVTDDGD